MDSHADQNLIDAFLATDGIPVDPKLPEKWDCTPNDERPLCHMKLWGMPYITTQEFFLDESARERWFNMWPTGTRYNVRCLDGGAWDRSTSRGLFATLEQALELARTLQHPPVQPGAQNHGLKT